MSVEGAVLPWLRTFCICGAKNCNSDPIFFLNVLIYMILGVKRGSVSLFKTILHFVSCIISGPQICQVDNKAVFVCFVLFCFVMLCYVMFCLFVCFFVFICLEKRWPYLYRLITNRETFMGSRGPAPWRVCKGAVPRCLRKFCIFWVKYALMAGPF